MVILVWLSAIDMNFSSDTNFYSSSATIAHQKNCGDINSHDGDNYEHTNCSVIDDDDD